MRCTLKEKSLRKFKTQNRTTPQTKAERKEHKNKEKNITKPPNTNKHKFKKKKRMNDERRKRKIKPTKCDCRNSLPPLLKSNTY
jgi:hypothetical protein